MFTGLVEGCGVIKVFNHKGSRAFLTIHSKIKLSDLKVGDSLAVDGCCLTVISKKAGLFSFDISDETIRVTAIKNYQVGTVVNVERPVKPTTRLGGHFVLGHVDCVGTIVSAQKKPGSLEIKLAIPKGFAKYVIDKGSITLNGISLTANQVKKNEVTVNIIPETVKKTNIGLWAKNTLINIEVDVLGKYIEKLMMPSSPRRRGSHR